MSIMFPIVFSFVALVCAVCLFLLWIDSLQLQREKAACLAAINALKQENIDLRDERAFLAQRLEETARQLDHLKVVEERRARGWQSSSAPTLFDSAVLPSLMAAPRSPRIHMLPLIDLSDVFVENPGLPAQPEPDDESLQARRIVWPAQFHSIQQSPTLH